MIKILHTADVHLDSPLKSLALRNPELRDQVRTATRTAFTKIVDVALEEGVAALLIAGDLFDGAARSASTVVFLTHQLERLRKDGIGVFYIKGNHDAENPLAGELGLFDNVHVFDGRGGKEKLTDGIWIHGVSFARNKAPDSLLPKFQAPVEGAVNIALLHTSLSGAKGHDTYAPCTLGDLTGAGYDYWALGHVHGRQIHHKKPWVVMPGMPQGRDMGESGPKSATLVTISETIEVKDVPTSVVEFLQVKVNATGIDNDDALRDLLRQTLKETAQDMASDSAVIRLELTGRTPYRWQILRDQDVWTETVEQYALEVGALWLDKVMFDLSDDTEPGQSATDELAKIMDAIREEPGFAESCQAKIKDMLQELPPKQRDELLPDKAAMDRLARCLAETGAERVLARMKGAAS